MDQRIISIVTGAASGLGRSLTRLLAQRKHNLILIDMNELALAELSKEIETNKIQVKAVVGDVGEDSTWSEIKSLIVNQRIRLLINCAGVAAAGDFESIEQKTWDWLFGINVMGTVKGCRTVVPILKQQKSGHILNIASRAGVTSVPEMTPYNASKAAIISLSETLYSELKPFGVGVTVACPSFFRSGLARHGLKASDSIQMTLANLFIENSKNSPDDLAKYLLHAVEKNKLYYFPSGEDTFIWRLKRLSPVFCLNLVRRKYSVAKDRISHR